LPHGGLGAGDRSGSRFPNPQRIGLSVPARGAEITGDGAGPVILFEPVIERRPRTNCCRKDAMADG
jgi:hypothetical protein